MGKGLGSLLGLAIGVGVINQVVSPTLGSVKSKLEEKKPRKKKKVGGDEWLAKELDIQNL